MARKLSGERRNNEAAQKSNQHPAAAYVDRIVRLEEEKREIANSIRNIYTEAKNAGNTKGAIRIIVKRKLESHDECLSREAIESEAEQIMAALGMLRDTPLGEAAVAASNGAAPNSIAREQGVQDGLHAVMDHAARWPVGEPGHGDYELGVAEGENLRSTTAAERV